MMMKQANPSTLFTLDPSRNYPVLVRGKGVYLYDDQGKQYLDAAAGIGVVAAGYGRKKIVTAMAAQALELPYVASNIFGNVPATRLAKRIARLMPFDNASIHFTSGGSEAVEAAIKICRQYFFDRDMPDKHILIGRQTSYHGATLGALSATGYAGRRKKFLPLLLDWPHIPPAYCYRCPFDDTYPGCDLACAHALEKTILEVGAKKVMGFIAEPIVGAAGGALVPPPDYWPVIRDICNRHEVFLIADEVLTGFGRTGKLFALEHWNVAPDLVVMAKGISSGYAPLGAIGVNRSIRTFFESKQMPLDHIFTFAANPVSTSAASAALDILEEESLVRNAAVIGEYMFQRLETLKKYAMVGDIRGLGLLAGIEFVRDISMRTPFPHQAGISKLIAGIALKKGLVTYPGTGVADGTAGDILSLFPPLTFTRDHVDEMVKKLDATLDEVTSIIT